VHASRPVESHSEAPGNIFAKPLWGRIFEFLFIKRRILLYFIFLSDSVAPKRPEAREKPTLLLPSLSTGPHASLSLTYTHNVSSPSHYQPEPWLIAPPPAFCSILAWRKILWWNLLPKLHFFGLKISHFFEREQNIKAKSKFWAPIIFSVGNLLIKQSQRFARPSRLPWSTGHSAA